MSVSPGVYLSPVERYVRNVELRESPRHDPGGDAAAQLAWRERPYGRMSHRCGKQILGLERR